jgi:hypothetical protein
MLEKAVNDLRMKLVDLETRSYKGDWGEGNFLAKRIQDVHPEYLLFLTIVGKRIAGS